MQKIRLFRIILLLSLFFSVSILASCGGNGADTNPPNTDGTEDKVQLDTPVVILDGDQAMWMADLKAEKFEISVNGTLSYLENSTNSKWNQNLRLKIF